MESTQCNDVSSLDCLDCFSSFLSCQEKGGGADSLMFARGALWDPSIFLSKPKGTGWDDPSSSVSVNRFTEEKGEPSREESTPVDGSLSFSNGAGDAVAAGSGFEAPRSLLSPPSPPPRLTVFRDYLKQVADWFRLV